MRLCRVYVWEELLPFFGPASSLFVAIVEFDEADVGWEAKEDSLLGGDFVQAFIDVWQVIAGDVANELAVDFVIAHAAVKPAEKDG
jgi:hypothetical protein